MHSWQLSGFWIFQGGIWTLRAILFDYKQIVDLHIFWLGIHKQGRAQDFVLGGAVTLRCLFWKRNLNATKCHKLDSIISFSYWDIMILVTYIKMIFINLWHKHQQYSFKRDGLSSISPQDIWSIIHIVAASQIGYRLEGNEPRFLSI